MGDKTSAARLSPRGEPAARLLHDLCGGCGARPGQECATYPHGYDRCPRCAARPGVACTTRRMIGGVMVDFGMRVPHGARPLLPDPSRDPAEIVAQIRDLAARTRARMNDDDEVSRQWLLEQLLDRLDELTG